MKACFVLQLSPLILKKLISRYFDKDQKILRFAPILRKLHWSIEIMSELRYRSDPVGGAGGDTGVLGPQPKYMELWKANLLALKDSNGGTLKQSTFKKGKIRIKKKLEF